MEINYTFYFFAFLRKMIKKLLTFCYWADKIICFVSRFLLLYITVRKKRFYVIIFLIRVGR